MLDAGRLPVTAPTPTSDAPRLSSMDNFRDVAGTGAGYTGADGRPLARGVFYRSNALTPSEEDLTALTGLNLHTVYDLRTDTEVTTRPDVLPAGVAYRRFPMGSGDHGRALAGIESADVSHAYMRSMNRAFVTGGNERAQFAGMLTDMATAAGPTVFHCTAGKDRTGWTSYLLLSVAGVDHDTILDDYLLTNECAQGSIAANLAALERLFGDAAAHMAPLVTVDASYLQAGIDQLVTDHGTVDGYLTDGLGLSTGTIDALRARLLG